MTSGMVFFLDRAGVMVCEMGFAVEFKWRTQLGHVIFWS